MDQKQKAFAEKYLKGLTYAQLKETKIYRASKDKMALISAWGQINVKKPQDGPNIASQPTYNSDAWIETSQMAEEFGSKVEKDRKGLSKLIIDYLKNKGWVHKGDICEVALAGGYLGETAGRTCRQLAEEGVLLVRHNDKNHATYKLK